VARIRDRIGINPGDIVIEGDDILGDGVKIAARLEGLADAGGIFISGDVCRQVRNKLDLEFEDLGERRVKNIAEPVRTYRAALAVTAGQRTPPAPSAEDHPAVPDKPSIAVLPFNNISGDPEQEYFADGITEDIITDLSKISGPFVMARNSSFAHKGQSPDVRQVSRELGIRYVPEGSVRKAGGRVRINAQMIDGPAGGHLWAERYDRALELEPEPAPAYAFLSLVHSTEYANGWNQAGPDHPARAMELAQQAIRVDGNEPQGYHARALSHTWLRNLEEAERTAARALELALHFLGRAQFGLRRYEAAEASFKRRLIHKPRSDMSRVFLASLYGHLGRLGEARQLWHEVMEINPDYSVAHTRRVLPYRDPAWFDHVAEGLEKAGLPE